MFSRIKSFFRLLFPIFFASALSNNLRQIKAESGTIPFKNGRFMFHGRTNGASRKKKTNRLHLSKKTRNKHRKNK